MSTAVILAGGKSSRMGTDKLQLKLEGKTFLEKIVEKFEKHFDCIYLSLAAGNEKYAFIKAERVQDVYPGCGPMAGLHAGLQKTADDGVFLVAGDLPFANPELALKVMALCGDADAAIIRPENGKYETAFAYYRKTLLPKLESELAKGHLKMARMLDEVNVRWICPKELGDWDERMLENINYPEDYARLLGEKPL